jgi:protoheme IX farnesyltransferase
MSMSTLTIDDVRAARLERVGDYLELTKPRIASLVLVTVAATMFVAGWGLPDPMILVHTLLGTALVAGSASALNQWLERDSDALMPRTASRPLPAARLSSRQVIAFAVITIGFGVSYLALTTNSLTALLGLLTWASYVWIYTPLKSRTPLNTVVGAVAGALPVLIGWAAVGAPLDLKAFSLFMILFLWQFPHFMAIAWIYRHQYHAAGLQMLTTVDPSGARAGAQAVLCALALLPVSLLPTVFGLSGVGYGLSALLLGAGQLACAIAFLIERSEISARRLLWASLVYLPAILMLLIASPLLTTVRYALAGYATGF